MIRIILSQRGGSRLYNLAVYVEEPMDVLWMDLIGLQASRIDFHRELITIQGK
ncbi:hypothetical protein [Candidatus Nitrosoglobus terrae]|uniref:hypothetical protein n=1 Tax=Candidatus Nitrosoglobus terrae TaxID=1630141 RepID=UPI0015545830|nr:hypothetical protein [Candidatus Nitrosoglobus terrae]